MQVRGREILRTGITDLCNGMGGRVMNKEMVYEELNKVREEMEESDDGEANFLQGWEKALQWVIRNMEREGE